QLAVDEGAEPGLADVDEAAGVGRVVVNEAAAEVEDVHGRGPSVLCLRGPSAGTCCWGTTAGHPGRHGATCRCSPARGAEQRSPCPNLAVRVRKVGVTPKGRGNNQ